MKKIMCFFLICMSILPSISYAQIVDTKSVYTYDQLTEDLANLKSKYPDLITYKSLGTTEYGRKIWAIRVGTGQKCILLNGAHHAREWMTSMLLMKMIETYADAYEKEQSIGGIPSLLLDEVSIWIVPMVNPDGVTLQQLGLYAFPTYVHPQLIEMNEGSSDFRRWKANLQGVDLNRQYPANWTNLRGVSYQPRFQSYKGTQPLEAIEVKSLVEFTNDIRPEIAVSYHSSGNVLFLGNKEWGRKPTEEFAREYYAIAKKLSRLTKYELEKPAPHQQGGGYTDWFLKEFKKPAFTVEIGKWIEDNNLPLNAFPRIWERNKEIGLFLVNRVSEQK